LILANQRCSAKRDKSD